MKEDDQERILVGDSKRDPLQYYLLTGLNIFCLHERRCSRKDSGWWFKRGSPAIISANRIKYMFPS
jgi:hypothetical protein